MLQTIILIKWVLEKRALAIPFYFECRHGYMEQVKRFHKATRFVVKF